jgi:hypothetical protein
MSFWHGRSRIDLYGAFFMHALTNQFNKEVTMQSKRWTHCWLSIVTLTILACAYDSSAAPGPGDFAAMGRASLAKQADARLSIRKSLGFRDGDACIVPPTIKTADVDMHRTLLVHDAATLNAGNFTLRRTLQKLADDVSASAPGTTAETIFQQLWDTQNDAAKAQLLANTHCSDNGGKLNGFPWGRCPRPEGEEAIAPVAPRLDNDYQPIAIVNRIDLAGAGWRNCGEHRIAYVKHPPGAGGTGGRFNYIIFEAILPNPKPGCRSGCRDVIDFWLDLSTDSSPASRAAKLENFLYTGLPGFRPVVHSSHYTSGVATSYGGSGSGQIRTNQFLPGNSSGQRPWTLKEFKTLLSCTAGACDYDLMPIPVKMNPYFDLWSADVANGTAPALPFANPYATPIAGADLLAQQFQSELVAQITAGKLAANDLNDLNYSVSLNLNAAASHANDDKYSSPLLSSGNASFRNAIAAALAGFPGLTPKHIANRAVVQSCAGCHSPNDMTGASGDRNALGPNGLQWPQAGNFAHVQGQPSTTLNSQAEFDPVHFGGNTNGFPLSPALIDAFLPHRRTQLVSLANQDTCDCVPQRGKTVATPLTGKQVGIIKTSTLNLQAALGKYRALFDPKETPLAEQWPIFAKVKTVMRDSERARDADLAATGLTFEVPSLKPTPAVLSAKYLEGAERTTLKQATIMEIANSEPPRETVTGSFRVH